MEIQRCSQAGVDLLVQNEGLVLKPYLDTVKVPTIGIGCTYYENGQKVRMTDPPITKQRAIELFRHLLKHYELGVYSVTRDDITQNQFDALVSLAFNIGITNFKNSTLLKRINLRASDDLVRKAFLMWNKPPEIMTRRLREVNFYFR